jgi:hypothetical protein
MFGTNGLSEEIIVGQMDGWAINCLANGFSNK